MVYLRNCEDAEVHSHGEKRGTLQPRPGEDVSTDKAYAQVRGRKEQNVPEIEQSVWPEHSSGVYARPAENLGAGGIPCRVLAKKLLSALRLGLGDGPPGLGGLCSTGQPRPAQVLPVQVTQDNSHRTSANPMWRHGSSPPHPDLIRSSHSGHWLGRHLQSH